MNELFITQIRLKDEIDSKDFESYPLNIKALKNFVALNINSPVTIFNGENGCGKSTIIEAVADILGMPVSGGNQNMGAFIDAAMSIGQEDSALAKYLVVAKSYKRPNYKYFFRAESFHELSYMIDEDSRKPTGEQFLCNDYHCSNDLLGQSHGESFIDSLTHQLSGHNLYLLDEPESALSPQNQLKLLCLIDECVKNGSQFIIATHSPIIMGYRNAKIINIDEGMKNISFKQTNVYNLYKHFLDDPNGYQRELLDDYEEYY